MQRARLRLAPPVSWRRGPGKMPTISVAYTLGAMSGFTRFAFQARGMALATGFQLLDTFLGVELLHLGRLVIVASIAGVGHVRPGVAGLAAGRRVDVLQVLTGGLCAVMATRAGCRDVGMIECGGNPGIGRVTFIAVIAARNVRLVLACSREAIVAREAGADYLCVIDEHGG